MTSDDLRKKFIKFFEEKGHKHLPSASLVPQDDPSVLFITAGMHPLVPYLMGEKHPSGKKLTNVQKCIRTDDIEKIGNMQHLTFFEMLGYWSLGDYFKKESIKYTFEFYTKVLGFKKDDIIVTVFEGDKDASFDKESFDTWKDEIGIPEKRIYKYDKKENWWGPVSEEGPCGPCTEMFVDTGIKECNKGCGPSCECDKFVEIGNNVFMEYFKNKKGEYEKLKQKNVDVGLGFERLVMLVQKKKSVYETDLFEEAINKIKELSKNENELSTRIIADHIRAATFALADHVEPSNIERGYIVRRLIRRAIRHGRTLGIEGVFTSDVAKIFINNMKEVHTDLDLNRGLILEDLEKEENKFRDTLVKGLNYHQENVKAYKRFNEAGKDSKDDDIPYKGGYAFIMYERFGFPPELLVEEIKRDEYFKDIFNEKEFWDHFNRRFSEHQTKAREGAEKKFKGGLGDQSEMSIKYHTATHLLHRALMDVLGSPVNQAGSNITSERLRFDFKYPEKVSNEDLKKIENKVNKKIKEALPVTFSEMSFEEAVKTGALGFFESKYGDMVKVYDIGGYSKEICGGPHVKNTKELGTFKIKKEESSSQGVRRIKAILE